jgi:hypothetical protein
LSELFALLQNKVHLYFQHFPCSSSLSQAFLDGSSRADSASSPSQHSSGCRQWRQKVEWGCTHEFFDWLDRLEGSLWAVQIDPSLNEEEDVGRLPANATTSTVSKPTAPPCRLPVSSSETLSPASQEGAVSTPHVHEEEKGATWRLEVKVAVHSLFEISRAVAKLSADAHFDHVFVPWTWAKQRANQKATSQPPEPGAGPAGEACGESIGGGGSGPPRSRKEIMQMTGESALDLAHLLLLQHNST